MFPLIFTHSGQSSPEISIAIDAEGCELIFSDSGGSDGTALQIPSGNGTVPDLSQGSLSQHSPFGFVDSSSASEREADGNQLITNSQTPKRSDNDSDAPAAQRARTTSQEDRNAGETEFRARHHLICGTTWGILQLRPLISSRRSASLWRVSRRLKSFTGMTSRDCVLPEIFSMRPTFGCRLQSIGPFVRRELIHCLLHCSLRTPRSPP